MNPRLTSIFAFIILVVFRFSPAMGQTSEPFTCVNAQKIVIPLLNNDFSKSEVIMEDFAVNAVYYLYQDKFTFWYKLVAEEDAELRYSVIPSNTNDRYEAIVYAYNDSDFCEALVKRGIRAVDVLRAPFTNRKDGKFLYRNTLQVKKGNTYYLSVLSLNENDCGHKLFMQSKGEDLSINAIHRPCYDVKVITDIPDYTAAFVYEPDIDLNLVNVPDMGALSGGEDGSTGISTADFSGGKWINDEDGIVNPGDRILLDIKFQKDSTELPLAGLEQLNQLADFLQKYPDVQVAVEGHLRKEEKKSNLTLNRAESVKEYLVKKGVKEGRITTKGLGADHPLTGYSPDKDENERIEILITR